MQGLASIASIILAVGLVYVSLKVAEQSKAELIEEVRQLNETVEDLERELIETKRLMKYFEEKAEGNEESKKG